MDMEKLLSEIFHFKRPRDYVLLVVGFAAMIFSFIMFSTLDIPHSVVLRSQNIRDIPAPVEVGGDRFQILRTRKVEIVSDANLNKSFISNVTGFGDVVGQYEGQTGVIYLNRNLVSDTGMPTEYNIILRHEYGHALFEDIMGNDARGEAGYMSYLRSMYATVLTQTTPDLYALTLPPDLREIFYIYKKQPVEIYGDAYDTKNLSEFFAESYARYLTGNKTETLPVTAVRPYEMSVNYNFVLPLALQTYFEKLEAKY